MLTDDIRERYRTNRAEYGVSAVVALHWARDGDPEAKFGLDWNNGTGDETLQGSGRVGEFTVRAWVVYDRNPVIDGTFTDTYRDGAIQNPAWRPNTHNTLRWYIGINTVGLLRRGLSAMGVDKHRAYTRAVAHMRDAATRDAEPELYVIRAKALSNGVCLGESSLHGFDVPEIWEQARQQLINAANDCITEAIGEARERLAKLTATLPKHPGMRISVNDSYANTQEMADGLHAIAELVADGYTSGVWPHNFDLTGEPTATDPDDE